MASGRDFPLQGPVAWAWGLTGIICWDKFSACGFLEVKVRYVQTLKGRFLGSMSMCSIGIQDLNLVITVPADALAPSSAMELAISQPKMARFPRNEKQTHRLISRPQIWPPGLTLAMTLTLNFQGQIWNLLYLSQKWSDCHETKSKHIDWSQDLKRPQIWPSDLTLAMTLTLNFQGQIWNWLYLCQKWSDCHEMKSEHIDWTLGLKCDHQIWPWPWPWPWIFKVKYEIGYISAKWSDCHEMKSEHIYWTLGLKCDHQIWPWPWPWLWIFKVKYEICHISTKSGPIAMRRKANISIWTLGLKCDNGFDLGHDLDISISRSCVVLTIWWPRSGVRIYQIVTGVTSVVGVPSTHLVLNMFPI